MSPQEIKMLKAFMAKYRKNIVTIREWGGKTFRHV